ncbi:MAG TPA: carboxypeptidase-like regulatory domain-containing protein [Puia sp.]|nr:carboxypeptidase-like regulatory domain-containing protein [Puia sp.]
MRILQIILLLFVSVVHAQDKRIISGNVVNQQTGAPIPNASVYIANTSRGSVTDAKGFFELRNVPLGNYELVVSFIGFSPKIFQFSPGKLPLRLDVRLEPKIDVLQSVTVQPFEKDGWVKWGRFFLDHFIGTSAIAKEAKIKNQQVLRFRYSAKENTLNVVSNEPLLIENPALGYRIKYDLDEFTYDSSEHALYFQGHLYFEDLIKENPRMAKRWRNNRRQAYGGSIMHFMRCLYAGTLTKEGFEVHRSKLQGKDFYEMSPKLLSSDSIVSNSADNIRTLFFDNTLTVIYKNAKSDPNYSNPESGKGGGWRQNSIISLRFKRPLIIEYNGNYSPPLDLFLTGYWSWSEKIGHILPLDYDASIQNRE